MSCRVAALVSNGSKMESPPQTPRLLLAHITLPLRLLLLLLRPPNSDLWSPTQSPGRSLHREGPAPRHLPALPLPWPNHLQVHPQLVHPRHPRDRRHLDPHPGSDEEEGASNEQLIHLNLFRTHPCPSFTPKTTERRKILEATSSVLCCWTANKYLSDIKISF